MVSSREGTQSQLQNGYSLAGNLYTSMTLQLLEKPAGSCDAGCGNEGP